MKGVDYFASWFKCKDCGETQTNNSVLIESAGRYSYGHWELMCDHHLCLICLNKKLRSGEINALGEIVKSSEFKENKDNQDMEETTI